MKWTRFNSVCNSRSKNEQANSLIWPTIWDISPSVFRNNISLYTFVAQKISINKNHTKTTTNLRFCSDWIITSFQLQHESNRLWQLFQSEISLLPLALGSFGSRDKGTRSTTNSPPADSEAKANPLGTHHLEPRKKPGLGCLIGILTMVCYNPRRTVQHNPLYTRKQLVFFHCSVAKPKIQVIINRNKSTSSKICLLVGNPWHESS